MIAIKKKLPEHDKKIAKISVYHSPEWRSWGVIKYNKIGDQIDEAVWFYGKKEALEQKKEFEKEYGISKVRKKK